MTINLTVPQTMQELRPRITVVGVGGAGCNAVNNMINANLEGVDFLVANTDGQALANSLSSRKIQLGSAITQGLGAGSKPEIGRLAAEESLQDVMGVNWLIATWSLSPQAWAAAPGQAPHRFCLLYTSPSPRDGLLSRKPSSA